jgi:hypothetical protein
MCDLDLGSRDLNFARDTSPHKSEQLCQVILKYLYGLCARHGFSQLLTFLNEDSLKIPHVNIFNFAILRVLYGFQVYLFCNISVVCVV